MTGQYGFNRMKPKLELCRDAEIGPGAARGPKQIGVFVFTRGTQPTIRRDDFNSADAVASLAQFGRKRSFPAAERIPGDPD